MFNHLHYVPTLRWKRGERLAIKGLTPSVRSSITPLIEIPPGRFKLRKKEEKLSIEGRVEEFAGEILDCWGTEDFFIDFNILSANLRQTSNGGNILSKMVEEADKLRLRCIPVTGLRRDDLHYQAVKQILFSRGIDVCVRLNGSDLRRNGLWLELERLLNALDSSPSNVHLIIEIGFEESDFEHPIDLINRASHEGDWKTLTLTCGSFPVDLSHLKKNEIHRVMRCDWLAWMDLVESNSSRVMRLPTFGDCTIRHPVYSEPPEFANTSASIRYTSSDHWLVLRGEALRKKGGLGYRQYLGLAGVLVSLPEYSGPTFSMGDYYINEVALGNDGPGNPETWLRVGFNHHISFVVDQISNLI